MKIKSIIVIVTCLLLLSSFAGLAKACDCDPPCGTCESCQAGVCVEYGNCWGGCPTCKTCSGCWCVNKCHPYDCEACVDGSCESWCDPVCEECEYGYGECVCLIWVTDVNSDKDVACVGCEITFTATTGGDGPVSCIKWDAPGGEPNEGTGETFTTSWDCPTSEHGSTVVTADTCRDGDDPSSWEKEVTIVAVSNLSPDVGTWFDDGDGDANTNSYAVDVAAAGVVTVTADSYPGVWEEDLPDGWDLTGGTGEGKLERTVDRTTTGITTITCTCGTSNKTTTIYVIRGWFIMYVDEGHVIPPTLPHVWWELKLIPPEADVVIKNSLHRPWANREAGYRPELPFPIWPGEVHIGNDGHIYDEIDQYYRTFGDIVYQDTGIIAGAGYVFNLWEDPGIYNVVTHDCTHEAVAVEDASRP